MNYFAYGSNLLPERVRRRAPSAHSLGRAILPRHRLCFHKRGTDHSGKCDALATGNPRDCVHGVVYALAERERLALDRAEGGGYVATLIDVVCANAIVSAFTYIAKPEFINPGLIPFDWYHGFVLAGARYHGLDQDYVARAIASIATRKDPDAVRARDNYAILQGFGTPADLRNC